MIGLYRAVTTIMIAVYTIWKMDEWMYP